MTYRLGLTGGIATGKSTVAAVFAEAGYPVVDADVIAREIVAPGQPALAKIATAFGPTVIQADGTLNRAALGAIVFNDPAQLARLNAINRPYLQEAIHAALDAAADSGAALVVGEIPLLFEAHMEDAFDGIAVVTVPPDLQLSRLMTRDGLSETAAQQRIAAQMPLAEKVARADFVLDNAHGAAKRVAQVRALIQAVLNPA